ncbi:MAG TPA: hypothetical protein PLA97_18925 [Rubrivivax sp.]|nr:hypothetical protein [Rubrivivax sp.]
MDGPWLTQYPRDVPDGTDFDPRAWLEDPLSKTSPGKVLCRDARDAALAEIG